MVWNTCGVLFLFWRLQQDKLKGEKSMTKQSLSLSTVLGTGVFCAALVAAPITASLISGSAYALDASMTKNCTSEVLAKLGTTQSALNSLSIDKNTLTDAINSAKALPNYSKYASVVDKYLELVWSDQYMDALGSKDTNEQKAIATELMNTIRDAGFVLINEPGIIDDFDAATSQDGLLNEVYSAWQEAHPEWANYADINSAVSVVEGNIHGGLVPDYTNADLFLGAVCSATKLDPSFKVAYTTGSNPFTNNSGNTGNTGGNTGSTTPDTTKPATIENSDNGVKVSGININVNYTLNVNLISTDLLKLTGNDFKNSTNQAFYDIFIRDSQNNVINNTGEVQVSIKLPKGMSASSDFIVYYVPTAMNGEYLTDQAQAIKGVKVSGDGWLTFQTNHFSVYGIVEYPKNKAPNTGVVAQSEGSATTAGIKVVAGIVSVLTAAGAAIVARRQIMRKKIAKNEN